MLASGASTGDLGPRVDVCARPEARALGPTILAPQPSWQVGSVWAQGLAPLPRYPVQPELDPFVVRDTSGREDAGTIDEHARSFGRHVRSLRRARGMTQDQLAQRSGLSTDTIRRIEHGSFSPSLASIRKLCCGLDLLLSTLFETFELGERDELRELHDLLAARHPSERSLAMRMLRALFDERR